MIRLADKSDLNNIIKFVHRDFARNYFIALSLIKGYKDFKTIYLEEGRGILFLRHSGNLQFVNYGQASVNAFKTIIDNLSFNTLIGPKSMCVNLGLKVKKEGALIASLHKDDFNIKGSNDQVEPLLSDDMDEVENLYSQIFSGYPKAVYMRDKLLSQRGIGYKITDEKIVSVAQSDFNCLIVGVATHPDHQYKGLAYQCMVSLIKEMFLTEKEVFLQYDNPLAGKLYDKLGFTTIDQVVHYVKE